MRRYGFVEKDIEPKDVYQHVKSLLEGEGFKVTAEDIHNNYWDLHAKKSNIERIALGKVRDIDVVIAGDRGKFEVQLHAGVWGRDLAVPAIEGIASLGATALVDVHSAHEFEERIWEQVVHKIDPSLKICQADGLLFKTDEELQKHLQIHQQQQQQMHNNMMNQMLMMGMLGGVGMFGMGMYGFGGSPGFI